jgi:hypothetical protein
MYLFEDQRELSIIDPVIIASGIVAVAALVGGLWMRRATRRKPPHGPAYQVFRLDAANAAILWGATQVAIVVGWALRVDAVRMPIWSYATLAVGMVGAVLFLRRERAPWPPLAKGEGMELLPDGRVQRGQSETWQFAMLPAMGAGLVSYLATAGHIYPHPFHWMTTGLTIPAVFALGLAMWSPRFKLTEAPSRRLVGSQSKRLRPSRKRRR